jgi:hypothetical protein
MTDAAKQYNIMRVERVLLRMDKGELSQEEEADFGAEMDVYWHQMTPEEQQAVEDSVVETSAPEKLGLADQLLQKGEHRPPRVEDEAA